MTQEEAITYISFYLDPASEPALSSADLTALVNACKRADDDGNAPSDDAWAPTYSLNAAIAQGWRIKASRLAMAYDMADDGISRRRSQMIEHCLKMAAEFDKQSIGVVQVQGTDFLDWIGY